MQMKCDLVPVGMFKITLTKVNVEVAFEYVNTYTPTKKNTIQKNRLNW